MAHGLENSRLRSPQIYHQVMNDPDGAKIDFLFFGMEKKIPVVGVVTFQAVDTGKGIKVDVEGRRYLG